MPLNKLVKTTKNNIIRNRWLSFATIFVISIAFSISTFFIVLAIVSQRAAAYYETKAQVIIFFQSETPEEEIFKVRDAIDDPSLIDEIEYISKEEALEIYVEDFEDDPDLVDTVTADSLPPSLGIRAKSIEDLTSVIKTINEEKETNAYIDEVMYFKDVVDKLKSISNAINYGTMALTVGLGIITFALIIITIGFNIMSHKNEIEIMHLVGSNDSFIKTPFIVEGAMYGLFGAIISSSLMIVPWYISMNYIKDSDFHFWLSQFLNDLSLDFLKQFDLKFTLSFYLIQIVIGVLFGSIGSSTAVWKYLNLKNKK